MSAAPFRNSNVLAALLLLLALTVAPAAARATPAAGAGDAASIAMLEHQARLFPGNATIRRRLAEAYAGQDRFAEALQLAARLEATEPANARLLIRLRLAAGGTAADAPRRLALCEETARRAGISVAEVATAAGLELEFAALLEAAGRPAEALRVLEARRRRAPARAVDERILALLAAAGDPAAPVFALERGLALPLDPGQPRRWLDHPEPRVADAVLDRLADSRTFAEEERWIERRAARGETEAALAALATLAEQTRSPRLARRGLELARGRAPAFEARYYALLPDDAIAALPPPLFERGLELTRANDTIALVWARQAAAHRPDDAAAQIAWFRLAARVGREETAAIAAVWRVKRDEPWILKERLRRRGSLARETLLDEYQGPLDPEIALWRLETALARNQADRFLPLAEALGRAELERRSDLVDSMARGLLQARLFDDAIRLDALAAPLDSTRAATARALIVAGRFEDAIRFGATEPGILARAALVRNDTPAAVKAATAAFGGGGLDALTIDLIAREAPTPGLRRLAALHARIRGMKRAAMATDFTAPAARLLFATDPRERAELYQAWGAPRRVVAILRRNPAVAPGLLVRAAARSDDQATVAAHLSAALAREPDAVDLRRLAFRLAAERGETEAMILHLETLDRIIAVEERAALEPYLRRLAALYAEKGRRALPDRAAALSWFERAAGRAPDDPDVRRHLAALHAQAGRFEEAVRFGATEPGILARAALARNDTPAAVKAATAAFGGGGLDTWTIDLIAREAPTPGLRRLAALHARSRGMKRAAMATDFTAPAARLLFATDPRERAELYQAWGAPRRVVAILRRNPAVAPALLVRAAARIDDQATVAAHLSAALTREPDAVDLRRLAFRLAAERSETDAMILHLETLDRIVAAEERAEIEPYLRRLAALYAEKGRRALPDRAAALGWFERAAGRAPDDPITRYNLAALHAQAGRIDSALHEAERATKLAPEKSDGFILLASLLKRKERHAEAAAAYRRALETGASLEARHELALLLKTLGEIQSAYVTAAEVHRLKPGDPSMARTYGVIAAQIGRWQEAIDPLRLAVRASPADDEARFYLAHSYLERGRIEEARLTIAPHPDAWTRIEIQARAEMAEKRPARAVELLRPIAIRHGGASLLVRALAQAADAALSRGEVAAAQRYWNEWLRIEPSAETPRALLAATRAPVPRPPVVVAAPVETAPAVVRALRETRPAAPAVAPPPAARPPVAAPPPVATASAVARATRETRPAAPAVAPPLRLTLRDAAAALRDGDHVRAEVAARQVLAERRDNVEALNLLGLALDRQGRRAAAIEAFERSLAVNPNQTTVREALLELRQP